MAKSNHAPLKEWKAECHTEPLRPCPNRKAPCYIHAVVELNSLSRIQCFCSAGRTPMDEALDKHAEVRNESAKCHSTPCSSASFGGQSGHAHTDVEEARNAQQLP